MGTSARPRLVCHSLWHTDGAAARRLAVDSRQTNHADFRSYRFGENAGYLLTGYNDAPQRFGSGGRAICETKLVPASLATYLKMNGSVGLPNSSIAKSVPSCRPPTESLARYRKLMQRSHKIGESGDRRNVWHAKPGNQLGPPCHGSPPQQVRGKSWQKQSYVQILAGPPTAVGSFCSRCQ